MRPDSSPPFETVREVRTSDSLSLVHPGWAEVFPWLVQGTTTRGEEGLAFDLGLFSGGTDAIRVRDHWKRLLASLGFADAVHAHQVHGCAVHLHESAPRPGTSVPALVEDCDGHVTATAGLLLAVTTADCVPVFVADDDHRVVAALHAGWRGAAAGVLERGLALMSSAFGTDPGRVSVHLGPSICGQCYEVGPEVFEALGQSVPDDPTPIDLRAILGMRAVEVGVPEGGVTVSAHCTRCTGSPLFSHRGGNRERQVGFVGIRL